MSESSTSSGFSLGGFSAMQLGIGFVVVVGIVCFGLWLGGVFDKDDDPAPTGGTGSVVPTTSTSTSSGTGSGGARLSHRTVSGYNQEFGSNVAVSRDGANVAFTVGAGTTHDFVLDSIDATDLSTVRLGQYANAGIASTAVQYMEFNHDGKRLLTLASGTNLNEGLVWNTEDGTTTAKVGDLVLTGSKEYSRAYFMGTAAANEHTVLGVNLDDSRVDDTTSSDGVTWAAGSIAHATPIPGPDATYRAGQFVIAVDSASNKQAEVYKVDATSGALTDAAGDAVPDRYPIVVGGSAAATWGNAVAVDPTGLRCVICSPGDSAEVYTRSSVDSGWDLKKKLVDKDVSYGTYAEVVGMNSKYIFMCSKTNGASGNKMFIYEIGETDVTLVQEPVFNTAVTDTHLVKSISVGETDHIAVCSGGGQSASDSGRYDIFRMSQ